MLPSPFDRSQIPHKPGVYIYKDNSGQVLYVGKAIDLNHRVSSYFQENQPNPKTTALVQKIASVETIVVLSEIEALLLEANLIKKYLPPFNVMLTDDKDYLYIKVTNDPFPKVITARKKEFSDAKDSFGPFPSSRVVKTTLKKLRRVFPWCNNPPKTFEFNSKRFRACFYYHLGLCPGACVGKISRSDYQKIIFQFIKFMQGKKDELIKSLGSEMNQASKNLDFETAQRFKKTIEGINYITQSTQTSMYLENPNFLEKQNILGLEDLKNNLKLNKLPERIETYDISNIQGHQAVGALVVLTGGEIDKKWYRKFKIKIDGKPNDFAMIQEIVSRRLKHQEWPFPDLIIIDGGRGQVRAAQEVLVKIGLNIPIFGLAKRLEWLYTPGSEIIKLKKTSLGLRLLQKIRDEAHRFGITYHRKLRSRAILG